MRIILTAREAGERIHKLIEETSLSHQPITITGKQNNAVLVSESDWCAIQETLHLTSIPSMRESIKEGLATPLSECSDKLEW